jgi:hypothetical protein
LGGLGVDADADGESSCTKIDRTKSFERLASTLPRSGPVANPLVGSVEQCFDETPSVRDGLEGDRIEAKVVAN